MAVRVGGFGVAEVSLRLCRHLPGQLAGFGMITDLRNDLYDAVLRRSVAFFQKHTTGTLLSTLINDIEKVQFAMSTCHERLSAAVLYIGFHGRCGGDRRRQAGLGASALFAGGGVLGSAHWARCTPYDPQGAGQTGRDSEHSSRDDYGQSHREGVRHGIVGDEPVSPRGAKAVRCKSEVGQACRRSARR